MAQARWQPLDDVPCPILRAAGLTVTVSGLDHPPEPGAVDRPGACKGAGAARG